MPATPLPTSERYFAPGITKVYFLPAVADPSAPSRVEINAGTDLTAEVADIAGWTVTSAQIATPDLASRFNSKIGGMTDAADSSLTFYADRSGVDVRTVLPRDTRGFILFADGGDEATKVADVYPVQVVSVPKQRGMTDAVRISVDFSITDEPAEDVTLPAAA